MERAGRAKGKSKGADEIFSASCQKAAADKEVGWRVDDGGKRGSSLRGGKLSEETLYR